MEEFWVFGYGSLMWRPGFDFIERVVGRVHGFHRALCVYSHVHRGTPERPGLVLGLDRGGSCRGVGYRVAASMWQETVSYLRAREQVTLVYREASVDVMTDEGRRFQALTYAIDRSHPQYAGRLPLDRLVELVRQGVGRSGHCTDYIRNTVSHLRELGIHDTELEKLVQALHQLRAMPAPELS
jgi:cation transport protein ChaC